MNLLQRMSPVSYQFVEVLRSLCTDPTVPQQMVLLNTHFPILLPVSNPYMVPMENRGLGSASFKPRPSFIQTHPKSKTSNVWARGEKSDDGDFQKSTWEGSGKELWLSSAWCPRLPAQGTGHCFASPGLQPMFRDFSLPPYIHTTYQPLSCLPPRAPDGLRQDVPAVLLQT